MKLETHRLLGILAAFPLIKVAGVSTLRLEVWQIVYAFAAPYLLVAFANAIIKARLKKVLDAIIHGIAIAGIILIMRLSLMPALSRSWLSVAISDIAIASPILAMVLTAYYAERGGRFPDLDWTKEEELRIKRGIVTKKRLTHRVLFHNLLALSITATALSAIIGERIGNGFAHTLLLAWIVGYSVHLASDAFTKMGCAIFYPFSRALFARNFLSLKARRFLMSSGKWQDNAIALLALIALFVLVKSLLESFRL